MQSSGMGPGNPGQPFDPPIPSPSGGGNYGISGPPQIRFDVIGQAWSIVKESLGIWIPALLIVLVISGLFGGILGALTGGGVPRPLPGQTPFGTSGPVMASPNYGVMFIAQLLQFVVSQFLGGGLYRMAINQVRGRTISIGDIFTVTDVLPALLIGALLTGIATFLGFLLCVIPGLLLAGCLMFTIPLIVDRRMAAVEAMSLSFNTLKGQAFMAFLFLLVVGLVASLGILLCGVGILVTAPIGIVSVALLYRDFFGGESAQPANLGYSAPPPPIPPV